MIAGWLVLVLATADLAVRQLTRVAPAEALAGVAWAPGWSVVAAVVALVVISRRARSSRASLAALFIALVAAGSFVQVRLGARLQSDGFYYYAFARSMWFDGDVDLTNDYRLLGLDDAQHRHLFTPTPTGHAQTTWAIGPALLWSPFLGVGHAAATWLQATRQPDLQTDGTSFPYRQAVCLAGLVYGLAGLFLCAAIARQRFDRWPAVAATLAIGGGSFVLWYLVREPTMSHAVSMAAVSLVVFAWMRMGPTAGLRPWALLGLAGGLMMAVRWQNAIVLLLPASTLAIGWWRSRDRAIRLAHLRAGSAFAVAVLVGFLPQMFAWHAIYGTWIARSPIAPQMFWTSPQVADLLWSSRSGLFATSPSVYLGAIGLCVLWRKDRALAAGSLVVFALMIWTNGAVEDWYGGAGYGGRRFDSLVPFFTIGLAALASAASTAVAARPGMVAAAALATLVLWNVSFAAVARSGLYRIGQPVSFGEVSAGQAGVLHDWIGHVPSMPANLIFAARNGVAPGQYDLLRPNRFLGDPTRPYGRVDIGPGDAAFLQSDGWHAPEFAGDTTFRWADAEATVLVPLDFASDLTVQVRLQPFEFAGAPPQTLAVLVNGVSTGGAALGAGWQVIEVPTPATRWRAGVNRVTLRFARATRPSDVGASDTRRLAAAIDYLRVVVPR